MADQHALSGSSTLVFFVGDSVTGSEFEGGGNGRLPLDFCDLDVNVMNPGA